jgi:hypothetical protein
MDPTATLTTGDNKAYFRVPEWMHGWLLVDVGMGVSTVSSSGDPLFTIVNVATGFDMLLVGVSVDANEKTSTTAVIPPRLDSRRVRVSAGDLLAMNCDGAGTGCKGPIIDLTFLEP